MKRFPPESHVVIVAHVNFYERDNYVRDKADTSDLKQENKMVKSYSLSLLTEEELCAPFYILH